MIAMEARDEMNPSALVLGSVSPLEDCYQPELTPDADSCLKEHRQIIGHLVDAGVDLILLETLASKVETLACVQAAEELAPGRWGISFCLMKSDEKGVMQDGTLLADLIPYLEGASFIGVNCIVSDSVTDEIKYLRTLLPDK